METAQAKKDMIENFKKRTVYVLDNEEGDIPIGTIAVIAVAIAVGVLLFAFRDKLEKLMKAAGSKVDTWEGEINK